jgi:hypothetical protein
MYLHTSRPLAICQHLFVPPRRRRKSAAAGVFAHFYRTSSTNIGSKKRKQQLPAFTVQNRGAYSPRCVEHPLGNDESYVASEVRGREVGKDEEEEANAEAEAVTVVIDAAVSCLDGGGRRLLKRNHIVIFTM